MVLLSIYQIPIVLLDHWGEEVIGYEYFVLNVFLRNAGILGVHFASGRNIEMGDESGIGANTSIPGNTVIGSHVILSRNCFILDKNHIFERTDVPLNDQGCYPPKKTIIEDDCWIGMNTLITPGRHISKGTIVGMGSVVTKDYPPYSIIGGAPAKLIRNRLAK